MSMTSMSCKSRSSERTVRFWMASVLFLGFLIAVFPATKVFAADTDGDGLSDTQEQQLGTDPNNPDSDVDGMTDGCEVSSSLNPLSSADAPLDNDHDGDSNLEECTDGTSATSRDTDGDRIPDGYETDHGLNPLDTSDASLDNDSDGSSNVAEFRAGTDPNSPDASVDQDGDGISDDDEAAEDEVEGTTGSSANPFNAGLDRDGDGFSNLEERIGQSDPNDPTSRPNSQTVMTGDNKPIRLVTPPNVSVTSFTWIDPATLPQTNTPDATFPYGLLGMNLAVTTPGEHVKVALTFPGPVNPMTTYDHFGATITDPNSHWVGYFVGSNDGDATIILNLADGGEGDEDVTADGTIHDPGGPSLFSNSWFANMSARGRVGTGTDALIGGLVISGTTPKTVLIRGRGPSMGSAPYNYRSVLQNPKLLLYSGQTVIAQNDDWQTTDLLCGAPAIVCSGASAISATKMDPCRPNAGQTVAPSGCTKEAALYVTLPPGAYTVRLEGVNLGTGVGLIGTWEQQ